MSYVDPDYKSKAEFRRAVDRGVEHRTYNPSGLFPTPENGTDCIEGPHYPKAHRWYASVEVQDGVVIRVIR